MPAQKLPDSLKTEAWAKQCVDAIIAMGSNTLLNGRTSRQNKQVNYDLYNSKFDESDFEYVTKPYGTSMKVHDTPAQMQNYNIIRSKIELLKGEEIKRPFNFFARGNAGGVESAREEQKRKLIIEHLKTRLMGELGIDVEADEASQMSLPDIEK